MKLSDKLKARRTTVSEEMRGMVDAAATENRDLTGEERTKFDSLKSDKDRLSTSIADAEATEDADRQAEGRDLNTAMLAEGEVRALLPEQRMASLVQPDGTSMDLRSAVRALAFGERRALGENVGALGGWLVPESVSATVIDLARAKSVLIAAGARTIPMTSGEMVVVKLKTDPTPAWRKEHEAIPESAPTFEPLRLKAQAVGTLVRISIELLEDAPPASQAVENAIAGAMATEMDRVGVFGTGNAPEPLGVYNTPGVNSVSMGANGATPANWDAYLDAILAIETANGSPNAIIMSPRSKRTLAGLKDTTGQPLAPPKEFTDLKRLVSNQIPTNLTQGSSGVTSVSIVGDFSQMALAMRTNLVMEATRVGGTGTFAQMEVLIRCYARMDVAVFRPQHFAKIVGIKA